MYANAQYMRDYPGGPISMIRVEINGTVSFVPLDPNNVDYRNMMQLVESGQLVIQPAEGAPA